MESVIIYEKITVFSDSSFFEERKENKKKQKDGQKRITRSAPNLI